MHLLRLLQESRASPPSAQPTTSTAARSRKRLFSGSIHTQARKRTDRRPSSGADLDPKWPPGACRSHPSTLCACLSLVLFHRMPSSGTVFAAVLPPTVRRLFYNEGPTVFFFHVSSSAFFADKRSVCLHKLVVDLQVPRGLPGQDRKTRIGFNSCHGRCLPAEPA